MPDIKVLYGDCRNLIPTLGEFDFIFADPPFNIGEKYSGYKDNLSDYDYCAFTQQWITYCWEALKQNGVIILHGPIRLLEEYLFAKRRIGMNQISSGIWYYNFGQHRWTNWIDDHCHWLAFCKGKKHTWNYEDVLIPSVRKQMGDARIADSPHGGMRVPGAVFGLADIDIPEQYFGRVQGTNAERIPSCPNQLPEKYLERFIRAYTNPGDRILDPFGGSGTTAVVAQALSRNCVTIDISCSNTKAILERLKKGAVRV